MGFGIGWRKSFSTWVRRTGFGSILLSITCSTGLAQPSLEPLLVDPLLSDGKTLAVVFPNVSIFCVVPEYSFAGDYLSRFGLTLNQIIYVSELEDLVVTFQDGVLFWLEFAESASDGGGIHFFRSGCFNPEQTHFSVEKQWLGNSYFRYIIDIVEYE